MLTEAGWGTGCQHRAESVANAIGLTSVRERSLLFMLCGVCEMPWAEMFWVGPIGVELPKFFSFSNLLNLCVVKCEPVGACARMKCVFSSLDFVIDSVSSCHLVDQRRRCGNSGGGRCGRCVHAAGWL